MNKYREAFWNLEHDFDNYCCTQGQLTYEDMRVFEELVDKETPMKPYKDDLSYSGYKCSNCHNNIYELRSHNIVNTPYCIWCGQKLDWSDIDD